MAEAFQFNKTLLLKILPESYEYNIEEVSIREASEISNEIKLDAEFRVNVRNEKTFESFLSHFCESSGTSYNKTSQTDTVGKKTLLSGVRKCIHNVNKKNTGHELNKKGNKTGKIKEPGKDTNCPAEINFSISAPCDLACGNKKTDVQYMRDKFPLKIKLYFNHNHSIHSADALRFRPVSDETKKLLTDLFDEDVSPSSAHRRVLDYFENESADFTADRFHIPDYKWVFNFHAKYIKNKFGSSIGVDVIKKLKDTIAKYNTERGEKLAEVKQTASGETIVAICDSFNRRVHENIPAAGDMLIMDATANLDRNDSKLFHLMCPSPVGGLPVGTLITTRADETTISEALELYKTLLPENAFFGRGKDQGPSLVITDDDGAEKNALGMTWPGAYQILCIFHHLQALWTWLWKREHNIEKEDRPILMNLMKKIVYAENTQQFNEYVEAMKKNHTYKKYANFKNHMEEKILPRFSEWSVKERLEKKLPTHNQNTTIYVEYSFE